MHFQYVPHVFAGHVLLELNLPYLIVLHHRITASGAPRSPVNNCGEVQAGPEQGLPPATSESAMAVMNFVERRDVGRDEPDVIWF